MTSQESSSLDPAGTPFPERIGRYELLLPIGAGGMASVYLARVAGAARFERMVAVKLLHPHLRADRELVSSMVDEARIAGLIRHANVVPVFDAGDDPLGTYLVMEYIEGETVSRLVTDFFARKERLPLPVALKILDDLLSGLHHAHELTDPSGAHLGLVHRDVSPQNVTVGVDGVARLLDFGIAKAIGRETRTETGIIKGKLAYMSPEQLRGRAVDRRTDVWAAGVVAWELLAGERLYGPSDDQVALALRIATAPPRELAEVRPELGAALSDAVASAICLSPAERCPTAAELRRRLLAAAPAGVGLATPQEVGDLVHRLVGERLRERARLATATCDERQDATTVKEPAPAGVVAADAARRRRLGRVAALVAVAAVATVSWAALRRSPPTVLAASPNEPSSSAEPPTPLPPEVAAPEVAAPSAAEPAVQRSEDLVLSANVPMRSVDVGGRAVVLARPASQVSVQLTPEEREAGRPLVTVAVALDGRRASTTVSPGATAATLTFGPAARAARPRASSNAASPPLIGNPYASPR